MTSEQERKILDTAVKEAMDKPDCPLETRLSHVATAARRLAAEAENVPEKKTCPNCGAEI